MLLIGSSGKIEEIASLRILSIELYESGNFVHNVVPMIISMDDIEIVNDHQGRSIEAREYLAHEFKDLINALKDQIDMEPTAGMLSVLVNALKAYGDLYQVKQAPGASGKLTELQVSRLIQAAVSEERARVLEEVKAGQQQALMRASGDVRENLRSLSDKSLG